MRQTRMEVRVEQDDERQISLDILAHDARITVPRADSLLWMAIEKLRGGNSRDALVLVESARNELSDLFPWFRLLEGGGIHA